MQLQNTVLSLWVIYGEMSFFVFLRVFLVNYTQFAGNKPERVNED